MRYLVDANVVCEPTKRFSVAHVVEWLAANESELVADSVIMGEIWRGVDALPEGKKREELVAWFQKLLARMPTLEWTTETALIWGEMVNEVKRSG